MNKILISTILGVTLLSGAATFDVANADTSCQPIYGGGQTCVTTAGNISLDKKVQNPASSKGGVSAFVDNLGVNDAKYKPGETVTFQISVTNTGSSTLSTVNVKDTLPQYVDFVSGPGTFNTNSKVLSFDLANLAASETRTVTFQAKVTDASKLPQNQSVTCIVNQASATAEDKTATDNAQFCIEKPVVTPSAPVTKGGVPVVTAPPMAKTPPTGPGMLSLAALLPAGAAGIFLRRKAK